MTLFRRNFHQLLLSSAAALYFGAFAPTTRAATAADLDTEANQTLQTLYRVNPAALAMSKSAKATLVFPKILKAGLVFGGSYGEGVLVDHGHANEYYNSVSASWGWQLGAESYSYVVFLMTDKAVHYLSETRGWEVGVGPTVVVVDSGVARNLTTSTLKDDAYAFITDQQGLMASLSIEGTKISRIRR